MNKTTLSKKAYLLHLNAASIADGMKTGMFRSLFNGQGVEFSGVREYFTGDDVRAIDWNVTARNGKPYVKVFEEEHELDVFIVLDKSLSMNHGTSKRTRFETACECASLLAMSSFLNGCPVGSVTFDGKISFSCAPKGGREHLMMLLSQFEGDEKKVLAGSALSSALTGASHLLKKRTLIVVISDFRTTGWEDALGALCHRNEVVALRITDPSDERLPSIGSVLFADSETGYECVLPSSSAKFDKAWRTANQNRVNLWKKECIRHGGIPLSISTLDDCTARLKKFFDSREKR